MWPDFLPLTLLLTHLVTIFTHFAWHFNLNLLFLKLFSLPNPSFKDDFSDKKWDQNETTNYLNVPMCSRVKERKCILRTTKWAKEAKKVTKRKEKNAKSGELNMMWKLTWDVKINFSCQNTQCIAMQHLWFIFLYRSDFLSKSCGSIFPLIFILLVQYFCQKKTNYFAFKEKKKWLPKCNFRLFWTKKGCPSWLLHKWLLQWNSYFQRKFKSDDKIFIEIYPTVPDPEM